jgi:hypothetical protein
VYCAVPELTAPSAAPKSQKKPDLSGRLTWQQETNATCEQTFQPASAKHWLGRFTFTFSIGSDF